MSRRIFIVLRIDDGGNFEIKFTDNGLYFGEVFFGEVFGHFIEDRVGGLLFPVDEPIGDIGLSRESLLGLEAKKEVRDGNADIGARFEFSFPFRISINIRNGENFSTGEDRKFVSELGFSAGGNPDVLREETGSDDGGFLCLNEKDEFFGVFGQEVFSKEAL